MPAVSVLLPCYNAALTLDEALTSLVCQTLVDFEIVVVDDGSTDDTPHVLQAWAARDSRFHILREPHSGIVAALNTGLAACAAPYIARMDADDRAHPERLERQAAFLDEHPEIGLVSCRVSGFPENELRQGFTAYLEWLNALLDDASIRREIFVESPLPHPSVMFRREVVQRAGGYQENAWPEDYDLWLRLYLAGVGFTKLPEVLLDWREWPGRLTRTDARYSFEKFLRVKAYYLARGPLLGRDAVIIWGSGIVGRRLARQLEGQAAPLVAFVDIDPIKIGRTRRGLPICSPKDLPGWWARYRHPVVLVAVGTRGARQIIRPQLEAMHLDEGVDWWFAA